MPKIVCIIPARLHSARMEKKLLRDLRGKPLLQWAWEGASQVSLFDEVVIAADSHELIECAQTFGGTALLTSKACMSGTDRLIELHSKKKVVGDLWVNWQGDEPFLNEGAIQELLQSCENPDEEIWTLKSLLSTSKEIDSPNIVKVVTDAGGKALYFSRSPIPYGGSAFYKHIGLYAYRASALSKISTLSPTPLERAEKLEQLRFLEGGLPIHVHETRQPFFGIDTEEELSHAENTVAMID